jgi:hypothetical protein
MHMANIGIDFDPITGKLTDTENGVIFGDEINLVEPGSNSGWNKIDGIWLRGYQLRKLKIMSLQIKPMTCLCALNLPGLLMLVPQQSDSLILIS